MGCIEMIIWGCNYFDYSLFNRNMGCIEIRGIQWNGGIPCSLIETWDVLKSLFLPFCPEIYGRLIETWDVLKFQK